MRHPRKVLTRDGWIALKSELEFKTLGVGPNERREALIAEYADTHRAEDREAVSDAYRRAYMRAGLLPGNPDEILTAFPARSETELPVPSEAAPGSAVPLRTQDAHQPERSLSTES